MPLLTSAELTWMRDTIEDTALPDTGNILSVTYAVDGQGGATPTWGTATAGITYRLDHKTGNEQVAGGALKPFAFWQLTIPYNGTISTDNRFEDASGNQYSISSVDSDMSYHLSTVCVVEAV